MSMTKQTTVHCDTCGRTFTVSTGQVDEAHRAARGRGWLSRGRVSTCKTCRTNKREQQAS